MLQRIWTSAKAAILSSTRYGGRNMKQDVQIQTQTARHGKQSSSTDHFKLIFTSRPVVCEELRLDESKFATKIVVGNPPSHSFISDHPHKYPLPLPLPHIRPISSSFSASIPVDVYASTTPTTANVDIGASPEELLVSALASSTAMSIRTCYNR